MKNLVTLSLSGIALSSTLLADIPVAEPEAIPIVPEIAICKQTPHQGGSVTKLDAMEAAHESIQSILQNKEARTTVDKLKVPIIVQSMEEANKRLTRASMEKLADFVDFKDQQVVVFAWQGSGQDRLNCFLLNSPNPIAQVQYNPGFTRDLRTHCIIYSMPKDAKLDVLKLKRPAK